jgi:predicted PurR-regulated permease PerM
MMFDQYSQRSFLKKCYIPFDVIFKILFGILLLVIVVLLMISIRPTIKIKDRVLNILHESLGMEKNVDGIVKQIPAMLEYYQAIISFQNASLTELEIKVEGVMDGIQTQFLNDEKFIRNVKTLVGDLANITSDEKFIDALKADVENLVNITRKLNIDQLQADIHTIACVLDKFVNGKEC